MRRWRPTTFFRPHPLLRSGHAQTLAGVMSLPVILDTIGHRLDLPDGDAIVLHDECPASWRKGDAVALLIHGLGGDASSSYLERISRKLARDGVRCFRADLRCAGSARFLCQEPYHAGRSEDVVFALEQIERMCPGSKVLLGGFSLGGAICLRMLGERGPDLPRNLALTLVFCPPIDLAASAGLIGQPHRRFYDRFLVRVLLDQFNALKGLIPRAAELPLGGVAPRTLNDFDETITAPFLGYACAADYYRENSAAHLLHRIARTTVIIAADDDPIIPAEPFHRCPMSACTTVVMTRGGGHLGFLGRGPAGDPDWRWMDWRVVEAARRLAA